MHFYDEEKGINHSPRQ
ncbi:hypothetical protein [Salipaludibacillus agaradhaerens]